MSSSRVFASRLATTMASTTSKVARPALRFQMSGAAAKRTFASSPLQTLKRQQVTGLLKANTRSAWNNVPGKRMYSSEMAEALVEVSRNLGMGGAAIGLTGAGIGIGIVFGSLLTAVSRNPALRGQLFTYAILGFAFVEAIGLFDLMIALMAKFT